MWIQKDYLTLFWMALFVSLNNFHAGWSFNEIIQTWDILPCIFEFKPERNPYFGLYATQILTLVASIASMFWWVLSRHGKRRALMLNWALVMLAWGLKWIPNMYVFIFARAISGVWIGISTPIVPKFIAEFSRTKIRGLLIGLTHFSIVFGMFLWVIVSAILPTVKVDSKFDTVKWPEHLDNVNWRVFFIIPGLVSFFLFVLFLLIFRDENPAFSKDYETLSDRTSMNFNKTSRTLRKATTVSSINYHEETRIKVVEKHVNSFSIFRGSLRNAMLGGVSLRILQQFTGINNALQYSVFLPIREDLQFFTLRFVLSFVYFLGTWCSLYFILIFKRKTLLLYGLIMWCAWNSILFGVFDDKKVQSALDSLEAPSLTAAITLVIFVSSYSLTIGTVSWVYWGEVQNDVSICVSASAHWLSNFIIYFLPILATTIDNQNDPNEVARSTSGFFFLYSGTSILGFFFVISFIKETKGVKLSKMNLLFIDKFFDPLKYK